ncbi:MULTISPECIES: biotin--[acetyl-CoA-carboxylase] ligase [unclassified Acinetobacter]|uniref:biotin--[acetyl-CoA-carboxylase] ligase n=1 Tax=unclassified Acinetobacter TaxID=196816 RepID=UPI0029346DBD|nr:MULTISPECIES: biotin--[acetyl-CoA-carboxylase] ligase [unclassified Acinetobacter]WOE30335.1 biotin--[acetyl-CoA-carboxylase] ligase [Acinetobacter sp. SAAs470]WOE38526.1 biotin--[acetyl-CoA-carboxylase] ligase [Acinetobacter sp. SAAs474]
MDFETRQLQQYLRDADQLPEIVMLKPTTTSTNDDVKALASKGVQSILICSEQQTQGRGQQRRSWISPQGNIYLSALLNLNLPVDGRLALEIALNILQMPSLQHLDLQIKWPNDLYHEHKKWGGILVEPLSPQQVVIGVGINLHPITADDLEQQTSSLAELGLNSADRIRLIAELYLAIQRAGEWFNFNCYNLATRFNHYAAFMHKTVCFQHTQGEVVGEFIGIQNDGAIQIINAQGLNVFYQGRMRYQPDSQ